MTYHAETRCWVPERMGPIIQPGPTEGSHGEPVFADLEVEQRLVRPLRRIQKVQREDSLPELMWNRLQACRKAQAPLTLHGLLLRMACTLAVLDDLTRQLHHQRRLLTILGTHNPPYGAPMDHDTTGRPHAVLLVAKPEVSLERLTAMLHDLHDPLPALLPVLVHFRTVCPRR